MTTIPSLLKINSFSLVSQTSDQDLKKQNKIKTAQLNPPL